MRPRPSKDHLHLFLTVGLLVAAVISYSLGSAHTAVFFVVGFLFELAFWISLAAGLDAHPKHPPRAGASARPAHKE
jgi:hypothetical protein